MPLCARQGDGRLALMGSALLGDLARRSVSVL